MTNELLGPSGSVLVKLLRTLEPMKGTDLDMLENFAVDSDSNLQYNKEQKYNRGNTAPIPCYPFIVEYLWFSCSENCLK